MTKKDEMRKLAEKWVAPLYKNYQDFIERHPFQDDATDSLVRLLKRVEKKAWKEGYERGYEEA